MHCGMRKENQALKHHLKLSLDKIGVERFALPDSDMLHWFWKL